MQWSRSQVSDQAQGPVTLERVDAAFLTPEARGDLYVACQPKRWIRGAVHDSDGSLVVSSQRFRGADGDRFAPANPSRVPVRAGAPLLEGTWMYGGHWMPNFGHFITETVTTLWPDGLNLDGLVFHRYRSQVPRLEEWQRRLVAHAGYGGLPIHVVGSTPVRVQHLLVPSRSVVLKCWVHPEAVRVWDRIEQSVGQPSSQRRVFLSRSRFNATHAGRRRTTPEWDAALDVAFADAGFTVVHPETLTVEEQIRLAAGAAVLAGTAGSALHLAVFGPSGRRVIEVGDDRTPDGHGVMQAVVDAARDHEQAHIPYGHSTIIAAALEDLGVTVPAGSREERA